jgi:hypothetical protein
MNPILADEARGLFVICMRSGFYAMRVTGDGRLLHVGFGPRDESTKSRDESGA